MNHSINSSKTKNESVMAIVTTGTNESYIMIVTVLYNESVVNIVTGQ